MLSQTKNMKICEEFEENEKKEKVGGLNSPI